MEAEILTSHLQAADVRVHPARRASADSDWGWHLHDECEMYLAIAGEKIFTVDGQEFCPAAGEVLYLAGRVPHKTLTRVGSEGILLQFADPCGDGWPGGLTGGTKAVHLFGAQDAVGSAIAQCMRQVQEEFVAKRTAYESFIVAHIGMIAAQLERSGVCPDCGRNRAKLGRMLPLLEYMAAHCHQPLTLTALAAQFGFAPSYLSALFGQAVGMSFTECLLRMRVHRAQDLLLGGDAGIEQIAQACGFSGSSYFIKQFKRICGCTPHRLRLAKR